MLRRQFLAAALAPLPKSRPNILLLLADNWAFPHAGAYGDAVVRTPTFDRLAKEGVLFRHAFAPNPSCSPSRSLLLTGQPTHRLGEAASLYGPLSSTYPTYPETLAKQGYFVGFAGKGWGPGTAAQGNPAGRSFNDFAAFLKARPAGQPFCFWFGSHDPHVPWNRGAARRATLAKDRLQIPPHLPDTPEVRDDLLGYYAEIEEFDAECGHLLELLGSELDNTLVVMTSDNGWQMPRGLANCYDLGVRIPLVARYPAQWKPQERHDFVTLGALAPTFLQAAGLPAAGSLFSSQRQDAVFLERERHANVRQGNLSYPIRGIRTADYLYLRNYEPDRWPAGDPEFYWAVGPYGDVDDSATKRYLLRHRPQPAFDLCFAKRPAEELYDVRRDPGQIHNLAAQPAHQKTKQNLATRLDVWLRETQDPRATNPHTDQWDRAPYSGPKFKGAPPPN